MTIEGDELVITDDFARAAKVVQWEGSHAVPLKAETAEGDDVDECLEVVVELIWLEWIFERDARHESPSALSRTGYQKRGIDPS